MGVMCRLNNENNTEEMPAAAIESAGWKAEAFAGRMIRPWNFLSDNNPRSPSDLRSRHDARRILGLSDNSAVLLV